MVDVELENPITGGLVNGRELVEPPGPPLEEVDVDLHGLAGHKDLAPRPRSWAAPFEEHPGDLMFPEDPDDGGRRDEDLVVALEVVAEPHCPVLAHLAKVEDQGLDLLRDPVGADPRAARTVFRPLDPGLAIPPEPHVELAPRDPEEPACLTHVPRDLRIMLDHAQAGADLAVGLLSVSFHLHPGLPLSGGLPHNTPTGRESG